MKLGLVVIQVLSPEGIRGNDNGGRGGESRWLHQAYSAQRDLPNGSRQGGMATCTTETTKRDKIRPVKPSSVTGFVQRDPSNMAGFVQLDPSSVGKIRSSCMI